MQPTWDETEPVFDETQPVEQGGGMMDTLKQGMNMAKQTMANTPMGVVASGMDMAQKGADVIGERGAEELAKGGTNPYVAAAVGTAAQMAPSVVGAMVPTEGMATAAEEASPLAAKVAKMGTDARMRGFRIPGTAVDQAGELDSMRGSVNILKDRGIEPKMFQSAEDLGNEVKVGIGEFGQMVRDIPKKLDQYGIKPRLNNETLPRFLETELQPKYAGGAYDSEAAIAKEIAETSKGHSDSFQALLDLKQKFGEQGKFYRVNTGEPGAPLKAEMYQKAYGKVNEIIRNEINSVAPEFTPAWEQANEVYSSGKDVLGHLTKAAGKDAATDVSSFNLQKPLDMFKGTANRAVALGADTASKMIQSGSNALGKFTGMLQKAAAESPKAFAVAHYTLAQKSPEYRQMLEGASSEE
jgi:hypothetical protein